MPKVQVNLAEVADFSDVEVGKWRMKCIDVTEGESKKGNRMLTWDWEVQEGPSEGMSAKSWTVLEPENALGQIKQHMVAFGADPTAEIDIDTDICIGREVLGVFSKRKYKDDEGNDKERVGISSVLPIAKESKAAAPGRVSAPPAVKTPPPTAKKPPLAAAKKSTASSDLPF